MAASGGAKRQAFTPLFACTMTSFMIAAHHGRPLPDAWKADNECPFCRIISGSDPAHRVYDNEHVIAILGSLSPTTRLLDSTSQAA
jgi:hypothetical protein